MLIYSPQNASVPIKFNRAYIFKFLSMVYARNLRYSEPEYGRQEVFSVSLKNSLPFGKKIIRKEISILSTFCTRRRDKHKLLICLYWLNTSISQHFRERERRWGRHGGRGKAERKEGVVDCKTELAPCLLHCPHNTNFMFESKNFTESNGMKIR